MKQPYNAQWEFSDFPYTCEVIEGRQFTSPSDLGPGMVLRYVFMASHLTLNALEHDNTIHGRTRDNPRIRVRTQIRSQKRTFKKTATVCGLATGKKHTHTDHLIKEAKKSYWLPIYTSQKRPKRTMMHLSTTYKVVGRLKIERTQNLSINVAGSLPQSVGSPRQQKRWQTFSPSSISDDFHPLSAETYRYHRTLPQITILRSW